jgi:hypothetical protein
MPKDGLEWLESVKNKFNKSRKSNSEEKWFGMKLDVSAN